MTSDHNRIKIEINDRKTYRKSKHLKKQNHFRNNQFISLERNYSGKIFLLSKNKGITN